MIAVELASRLGADLGATSLEELWAEIERVSPLHQGVSQALLGRSTGRNGVVVPLGLETARPELSEVPAPLDPMADPGIASAEIHPAPPAAVGRRAGAAEARLGLRQRVPQARLTPLAPPARLAD